MVEANKAAAAIMVVEAGEQPRFSAVGLMLIAADVSKSLHPPQPE